MTKSPDAVDNTQALQDEAKVVSKNAEDVKCDKKEDGEEAGR